MDSGSEFRYTWRDALDDITPFRAFLQLFLAAGFSGAIYRNDLSPFLWVEFAKYAHRSIAFAILLATVYLAYYCFFWEIGFVVLRFIAKPAGPDPSRTLESRTLLIMCAAWFPITLIVIGGLFLQFIRNLPTILMNRWVLVAWLCFSGWCVTFVTRLLRKRHAEQRRLGRMARIERQSKRPCVLVAALALVFISTITTLGFHVCQKLDADTKSRERWERSPFVDTDSVAEEGKIYGERRRIDWGAWTFENPSRHIQWWVIVPSTKARFSCSWGTGYSGFRDGDVITIIHPRNISEGSFEGFIVGLQGDKKDRAAGVSGIDVEME